MLYIKTIVLDERVGWREKSRRTHVCLWGGDGVEDMEGKSAAIGLSANKMASPSSINGSTEVDMILSSVVWYSVHPRVWRD